MAKSRPPEYIRNRRTRARTKRKKRPLRAGEIWGAVGIGASILGLLGLLAFIPRISIDSSGTVRSHDPFGTVFYLSNDSILSIHDISVSCGLNYLRQPETIAENIGYDDPSLHARLLSPGQKMTLNCHSAFTTNIADSVKTTISVTYRPDFWWWTRTTAFQMEALRSEDGSWIWKRLAN